MTRATAWSNGSKLGRVTYQGVVPSLDVLGGLTFNATDALSLNQSGSVSASDCTTKNSGKIYCVSKDPVVKKKVTAVFKPTATPGAFSFKVTMNKLEVPRPQAGPLAFEINEGAGATYQGSNANCAANVKKLVCKN
ncbi:MAG: hypothetical protein P8R42_12305 [Candidatus Binatia bacterium]|nr:hypothetical protein [Candidatus Binatia bacterium]